VPQAAKVGIFLPSPPLAGWRFEPLDQFWEVEVGAADIAGPCVQTVVAEQGLSKTQRSLLRHHPVGTTSQKQCVEVR
jgi:hypothetical protein